MPGEESLHRRHGVDHGVGPRLSLRAGRVDPVPAAERDLRRPRVRRLPDLRARGAVGQHRPVGRAPDPALLRPRTPARAPGRHARPRRRDGHGRGGRLGRSPGPGHRPLRRAHAAEVARRDVGRARPTRPSARRSAPPCSAASWTSSTASSPTGRSTPRCAACWASWPSTPPTGVRIRRGARSAWPSRWRRRARRPCRRCGAGSGPCPTTSCACSKQHGGELRRHVKVSRIVTSNGRVKGVALGDGEVVTAPVVVSNLDPTRHLHAAARRRGPPRALRPAASRPSTTGPPTSRSTSRCNGLPEFAAPYDVLNEGELRRNVTLFGTAEQMQLDYEGCLRGVVPASPSFNLAIPTLDEPDLAPPGKHAASSFAFYFPIGAARRRARPGCATRWRSAWWTRSPRWRPTSPT